MKTINQIVQEKISYCRDPVLPFLEDKYLAKIFANFLGVPIVPLIFQCKSARELHDYLTAHADELPDFVIKTNHGCGDVCIVRKSGSGIWNVTSETMNQEGPIDELVPVVASYMQRALHHQHILTEWAVAMIWPRRIILEPFLAYNDDYKVMVSDGSALFTYCCTARESETGLLAGVFDRDWNFCGALNKSIDSYGKENAERLLVEHFKKPENLEQMYSQAEKLSPRRLKMQRVDFFRSENGEFLLGEISAYSGTGITSLTDDISSHLAKLNYLNSRDNEINKPPRKVSYVAIQEGETSESRSALFKAFSSIANGHDIVVHINNSSDRSAADELVAQQIKTPGKIHRTGNMWSWDNHYILRILENFKLT